MEQIQFRDDDTIVFGYKYGPGSAGDKTYSSDHTLGSTDGFYNSTLTGTAGDTTGSVSGISDGTYNLPCKIIQSQGTGADDDANWQYNVLVSVASNVATFRYVLTRDYVTGAQLVTSNPWRSITIDSGVVLTLPDWDGSKGGIGLFFASKSFSGGGIPMTGKGFRGGAVGNNSINVLPNGQAGEGYPGIGATSFATGNYGANGNGGGGGDNGSGPQSGGTGGGGGNGTSGANGATQSGGVAGAAGGTGGSADLTSMSLGGGGGGSQGQNNAGGAGGDGGGVLEIVSPRITITQAIALNGNNGGNATTSGAGGGAGGSMLLKGQVIDVGSDLITATAGSGGTASHAGGAGGVGRIHADYGLILTGTTSPTIDSRQDKSLLDVGNFFFSF